MNEQPATTDTAPHGEGLLGGLRVLELGHFIAAPFCTRLLADMGADVIKVEPPGAGDPVRSWGEQVDGRSIWWSVHGRNKRSITANLKDEKARALVLSLVEKCDVVVENFRPGQLERWDLGPASLARRRPGLVMVRISGAGQDGPERDRASFGVIGEARGGLRYLCDHPPGTVDLPPVRVGISIGDSLAGMYGALGALAAVISQRTQPDPEPVIIDAALSESVLSLLEGIVPEYDYLGKVRRPEGSAIATAAPTNAYPSADGEWVIIAANSDPLFARLCQTMGRPELAGDRRFVHNPERLAHRDELDRIIADWALTMTATDLLARLEAANVPSCKIFNVADCVTDAQYAHRRMFHAIDDPLFEKPVLHPAPVPRIGDGDRRQAIRWPGPAPGQHNGEVYGGLLGLSEAEIDALAAGGAI